VIEGDTALGQQLLNILVDKPYRKYQRTASESARPSDQAGPAAARQLR
jgi:hypothetical protein